MVAWSLASRSARGVIVLPDGLEYAFEADNLVTTSGADVTDWGDETGNGWDLHTPNGTSGTPVAPTLVPNQVNGLPGVNFDNGSGGGNNYALEHYGGPFYVGPYTTFPNPATPYPYGETQEHTVYAVIMPNGTNPPGALNTVGGIIVADRAEFTRQCWGIPGFFQTRLWRGTGAHSLLSLVPNADPTANVPHLVNWHWAGGVSLVADITIDGVAQAPTFDQDGNPGNQMSAVPDTIFNHVLAIGATAIDPVGYGGVICAVMLKHGAVDPAVNAYLTAKWGPF